MAFSLKLAAVSATVLSAALILHLLTALSTSDLPTIYTSLISWLKPPYLYVVINCIIITIVASSRLQSKFDGNFQTPIEPVKLVNPVELEPELEPEVLFDSERLKFMEVDHDPVPEISRDVFVDDDMVVAKKAYEEIKKSRVVNKSVISMSAWTPAKISSVDLSFPTEKPPASARFSHRKPAKTASEGGRTLGVTKPKRQDTLDTTWKAINEGRSLPLTRHLRKSDTWETHGRQNRNSDQPSSDHSEPMKKSQTFDTDREVTTTTSSSSSSRRKPPAGPASKLSRSGGSGRLKKEPSLGQEELNRRVEAFIKKFNEDMRLQRQESLNQYMEMINRGAH